MIVPVVMCGGAGTRLWPSSRDSRPKHLLPLFDGISTFQATIRRFFGHDGFARPVVITSRDQGFQIAQQLAEIGADADVLLEPSRQDSAAAVAVGALHVASTRPGETSLVLAADHVVTKPDAFRAACREALASARAGSIMTFGIVPTWPATGYGYIRPGAALATGGAGVREFREKPDEATASRYIAEGCLWNSGNFLFEPAAMLGAFERHAPEVLAAARSAYERALRNGRQITLEAEAFSRAPRLSVDIAVMEKAARENAANVGVVPCDAGWSDIGTFDALWQALPQDGAGNAVTGDVLALDCEGTYLRGEGTLVAALGLRDLVVVAGPDAVLVADRKRAGDVKSIVKALSETGRAEATTHRHLPRPWGELETLGEGPAFRIERLGIAPKRGVVVAAPEGGSGRVTVLVGAVAAGADGTLRAGEGAEVAGGSCLRIANGTDDAAEILVVRVGAPIAPPAPDA